jgi:hypothetical protein
MPDCPTCKKQMNFERPAHSFATKQGDTYMGHPFPADIKVTMFENYICYDCGTRTSQAVRIALYTNPEIKELAPTK